MKFSMPNRWENFAFKEQKKEYLLSLKLRLKQELISGKKIYPPEKEIFKACIVISTKIKKKLLLFCSIGHEITTKPYLSNKSANSSSSR